MPRSRHTALRLLAPLVLAAALTAACGAGASGQDTSAAKSRAHASRQAAVTAQASGKRSAAAQSFASAPGLHPAAVTITRHRSTTAPGDVFVAPRPGKTTSGGPMIFDSSGHLVWFRPLAKGEQAIALSQQRYKGKPVLIWGNRPVDSYYHAYFTLLDSSYHQVARIHAGDGDGTDLHDFEMTPRNTALLIGFRNVPRNLSKLGGSAHGTVTDGTIQEVSVPSGRVLWRWSALKHIPLSQSLANVPSGEPWDAYHLNAVSEAADGNLLVSVRHTSTLYKISRKTGKIIWRLGGRNSNFKVAPSARFAFQHDARWGPNSTITMFDNGATSNTKVERQSSGERLRMTGRSVTLVKRFTNTPPLLSTSQGSFQALPDGHTFIGWGNKAYASEFDARARLVWQAKFPSDDQQSYSARRYPWAATPTTRPAVVGSRAGGVVTLKVSWNGATAVRQWEVLGGASPASLSRVGAAPHRGFETTLRVTSPAKFFAVRALDAGGGALGTSKAISPR